jgi:hypothetical protein
MSLGPLPPIYIDLFAYTRQFLLLCMVFDV